MIFMFTYLLVIFGLLMAGLVGLMPATEQWMIPDWLRYVFFGVGFILAFVGLSMVQGRANKTGAIHLLDWGRPGRIIWFYVYKDGTIKITPSVRDVENQLYSKELDAQIQEMKSYRLFDHSVRFVPEGTGHAVDLGMCLYVGLLKNKWGFTNIREARKAGLASFFSKTRPVLSEEYADTEGYYGQTQG